MTGYDVEWSKHPEAIDEQNIVMTVHFRPDKLPKDKAEWYEWLGNYAHTTAELIKNGILENKKTKEFKFEERVNEYAY